MLFDANDRLSDDRCAIEKRVMQNQAQLQWRVGDEATERDDAEKEQAKRFSRKHRNLRSWDGYGWDTEHIDVDSRIRNDKIWTNDPHKTQLRTRTFTAVPKLWRGKHMPVTESKLKNGLDTGSNRLCRPLTEEQFPVFHPTYVPPGPKHIVPEWTRGGDSSRELARTPWFMESLGYEYDGRMWVKKSSSQRR